jgi:tRNA dimethylallyltransferase
VTAPSSAAEPNPSVVAIVGTTASGKSELAIALALRLGGEVVSADSRQVYRGLDVGSGKVPPAERRGVPHHLLDVADVRERFTVAQYQARAFAALADVHRRGRLPLLVGGTGLYVRAVIDNPRYPAVAPDPELRRELERRPLGALVEELRRLDPLAAARLDVRNPRRVVRALEVTLSTGRPFSAQQGTGEPRVRALQLGLTWPAAILRRRIADRLEARLAGQPGLIDEVRGLLEAGVPAERLLELGLEYRFVTRHLLGELTREALVAELEQAIWRYAKRQLTWFRHDPRIAWLDVEGDLVREAEQRITDFLHR